MQMSLNMLLWYSTIDNETLTLHSFAYSRTWRDCAAVCRRAITPLFLFTLPYLYRKHFSFIFYSTVCCVRKMLFCCSKDKMCMYYLEVFQDTMGTKQTWSRNWISYSSPLRETYIQIWSWYKALLFFLKLSREIV